MVYKQSGGSRHPVFFAVAMLLLSALSYAADPTTSASATANGNTYSFGSWSASTVSVTLACAPGGSDCANVSYCTDTSNTCDPTGGGTAYGAPVGISTEGVSYIRYASANSTGNWGDTGSGTIEIDTTPPAISIIDDSSGAWTDDDAITASVSDNGSGIANTVWAKEPGSNCGSSQDSDLNSGTSGAFMDANNDVLYQNEYICFRATDVAGNRGYAASSEIDRLDTTSPTVNAGPDQNENSQFTQNGAASDSGSGIASYFWSKTSGPGSISFGNQYSQSTTVSADKDGTYVISLIATDAAGNSGSGSFTLRWITAAPGITISNPGSSPAQSKAVSASVASGTVSMAITNGSACDSSVSFVPYAAVTFTNESDNGKRVCYRVTDSLGNTAYNMSGAVGGIDTTRPVLALNGAQSVTLEVHSGYSDAGATATDNHDGDLASGIIVANPVNTSRIGSYTVTYDVADAAGNRAMQLARTVDVVDTTKPVITLLGNSSVTIQVNSNYTDEGATAWDDYDGNLSSGIVTSGQVQTNTAGTYSITYDVSDSSGNKADGVVRTVAVEGGMGGLACGLLPAGLAIVFVAGAGAYFLVFKKRRGPNSRQRFHSD